MTRQRKGLRPLSQAGLHRAPTNPGQRNFLEGGAKAKRTMLDAFNERQDERVLHPTKGWRTLNPKRARAQMLMAERQQGFHRPLPLQGRFIAQGY